MYLCDRCADVYLFSSSSVRRPDSYLAERKAKKKERRRDVLALSAPAAAGDGDSLTARLNGDLGDADDYGADDDDDGGADDGRRRARP